MNERDIEAAKRRFFQKMKATTFERFWSEMNRFHSDAFHKAVDIYREASEITLQPKQQKQLHDKFDEIRTTWDGLLDVEVDYADLTIDDILVEVHKEMRREAGIYGDGFRDLIQAVDAVDKAWADVLAAIVKNDRPEASMEIVHLIAVLVKLMRGLQQLVPTQRGGDGLGSHDGKRTDANR